MRYLKGFALAVLMAVGIAACGGHASDGARAEGTGPSDSVVRQALSDFEVMRIPGSGFETFRSIKNIRHGEPLEANGNGGIPAGTILYPIKADSSDKKDYTFAFYQDSFGEWKFQQMD
jgi:hypothetical protein